MLAVYVSGHGFGHSTRTAEVLGAAWRAQEHGLRITVSKGRAGVPVRGAAGDGLWALQGVNATWGSCSAARW